MVKNLPANAGDVKDPDLMPGLGRFCGGGHGNPFQYSCLENSNDRGTWGVGEGAIVHRVTQSRTQLKQLSMHTHKDVWPSPL